MIKEKIQNAINKQMNREFYSAYLYLSMSAYFESVNLKGFAHWMRVQAEEEKGHAMRLYKYLVERGGIVILLAIEAPPSKWKSPLAVFEDTYKHEQKVTGMIEELYNLAKEESENETKDFLQWFRNEQVEEESSANEILEKIKQAGESTGSLLVIDCELAKRGK